jgi:hypothetical protein
LTRTYRETKDEIILEGIVARELWKTYPHGKEFVSYTELRKACELTPSFPVVWEGTHDHSQPLIDASKAIGRVDVQPCDKSRGLLGTMHLKKRRLTPQQRARLKQGTLPLSVFQFTDIHDRKQQNLLFNHLMILDELNPRCPPDQCGIGVYDAMSEEEEKTKDDEKPVSEPVSEKQPENQKEENAQDPSKEPAPEDSAPDALQEIEALKAEKTALEAQLHAKEAELKAERDPLIGFLLQRGISRDAAEAMSLKDLQTTASALRGKDTQGLPGSVPAPTVEKSFEERKAEADAKFNKDLMEQSKKEFENW